MFRDKQYRPYWFTFKWGASNCGLQPAIRAAKIFKQLAQAEEELLATVLRWGKVSLQNDAGSTKLPASLAHCTTLRKREQNDK